MTGREIARRKATITRMSSSNYAVERCDKWGTISRNAPTQQAAKDMLDAEDAALANAAGGPDIIVTAIDWHGVFKLVAK